MKGSIKITIAVGTIIVVLYILSLSYSPKQAFVRSSMNTEVFNSWLKSCNKVPDYKTDVLMYSNQTESFLQSLQQKYGPISYSGVTSLDTNLTSTELERRSTCIRNGPHDRATNGSKFWGNAEHIRRTHHTYLKDEKAVLLEIGGNKGNDAGEFVQLYNPRYMILEPLEEYANILSNKFKNNSRVTVINLGLGAKDEVVMVKIEGANACATSKFLGVGGDTPLYIVNTTEFLLKIGVGLFDIDLMTMNCEGCEFEALETLLSTSLIKHFRNIQFATHSTIQGLTNPIERYCTIQELLSRTHRPTYQYRFIWESWRRRDLP